MNSKPAARADAVDLPIALARDEGDAAPLADRHGLRARLAFQQRCGLLFLGCPFILIEFLFLGHAAHVSGFSSILEVDVEHIRLLI